MLKCWIRVKEIIEMQFYKQIEQQNMTFTGHVLRISSGSDRTDEGKIRGKGHGVDQVECG